MASMGSDGAREASSRPLPEPTAGALAARRPFQAAAGQATRLDHGREGANGLSSIEVQSPAGGSRV